MSTNSIATYVFPTLSLVSFVALEYTKSMEGFTRVNVVTGKDFIFKGNT